MHNTVLMDNTAVAPGKIVCVGRNYYEHIKEMGSKVPEEIVLFCKPNSSITTTLRAFHGENAHAQALHYEGELCFAVFNGELSHFGFGLDITKRALQKKLREAGLPWEKAKAFDGSALFSDFLPLRCASTTLSFTLAVDGTMVQQGDESLMIYKPADILREIKQSMSLQDGDIIMTGTPAGVGIIQAGAHYLATVYQEGKIALNQSWRAE